MPKPSRNRHRQIEVLHHKPELQAGQSIARVIQACGENIYEVETADGQSLLYELPKRLRYVTYIKRGSFVFVNNDNTRGDAKVQGDIQVVIIDRFLNDIRKESFWPTRFAKSTVNKGNDVQKTHQLPTHGDEDEDEDKDEDKDEDDDWHVGMGNPNRPKWQLAQDDSDSSVEE